MRIWLDDERPMPQGYDKHVKTAEEAIELLGTGLVTAISLDNDLGTDKLGRPNTEGVAVARYIEKQAYHGGLRDLHVYVHTQNVVARREMCAALCNAKNHWRWWNQQDNPIDD